MEANDFIQHTLAWCKGEIFEGKMLLLYGVGIIIAAIFFWKVGTTPYAKSLFIPFLIVGALVGIVGTTLITSNLKHIPKFQTEFAENADKFVKEEKKRTDIFISWYPKTMWILVVIAVIGLVSYAMTASPLPTAISLACILMCFSFLMVDHFSKERAAVYASHISSELNKRSLE